MRALIAALVLTLATTGAASAPPAEAQGCRSHTYRYDPGKTPAGFRATATDGCNTVDWTGSIGQGPGGGTVTFRTVGNVYPWQPAGASLPSPAGGAENACRARAAVEANGYYTNLFRVPVGTEVTVRYSCD